MCHHDLVFIAWPQNDIVAWAFDQRWLYQAPEKARRQDRAKLIPLSASTENSQIGGRIVCFPTSGHWVENQI
jgi:hypothetical protein